MLLNTSNDRRYQLEWAARYGARVNERHARLFMRLRSGLLWCDLVLGGAAISKIALGDPSWAAWLALLAAVLSASGKVLDPGLRAREHRRTETAFMDLLAVRGDLDDAAFERKLSELQAEPADEIQWVRRAAYNDVLRETGHTTGYYRGVLLRA